MLKKTIIKIMSISPYTKQLGVNVSAYIKKKNYLNNFYDKEKIDDKVVVLNHIWGDNIAVAQKHFIRLC